MRAPLSGKSRAAAAVLAVAVMVILPQVADIFAAIQKLNAY